MPPCASPVSIGKSSGVCPGMSVWSAHRQLVALLLGSATGIVILMLVLQHILAPEKAVFDPLAYICSTDSKPAAFGK